MAGRTWYTSDLHLGHENIIKYCNRPFANAAEMNEAIVNRWNSVVHPDDTVYVLGDLALGKLDDSLQCASRLLGKKLLVPGNHDRCWSGHKKVRARDFTRYEEVGFEVLAEQNLTDLQVSDGHTVRTLLCHFPYAGDSQDLDRHVAHRPTDRGHWLIHGHTHSPNIRQGRQIHVGMDAWNYWPVQESAIITIIADSMAVSRT